MFLRKDVSQSNWNDIPKVAPVGPIIKGCGYERDKKYIEQNTFDFSSTIIHFRAGVQSDNEQKPFIRLIIFLIILFSSIDF